MSSIKIIADKLNLNKSTVSLALNHRPGRMSEETRRRILKAAEEMGYVPNQHAQQLATGRSRTVLVPFRRHDIFDDPFLAEVGKGIHRVLRANGYSALFDSPPPRDRSGGGGDELEVARRVRSRAFAGSILIEGYWFTEGMLGQVAAPDHPCVVTDYHDAVDLPYVGTVVLRQESGIQEAARLLYGLGHRRVALLNMHGLTQHAEAFRAEMAAQGAPVRPEYDLCIGATADEAAAAARRLLALPEPPTAAFVIKDLPALVFMREARRMGLRVPEDLSVISYDDTPVAQLAEPSLTSVSVDCVGLGGAMAQMLLAMLREPGTTPDAIQHEARLIERESVAAAAAAGR
jgi:LacI family transcriptional regulator